MDSYIHESLPQAAALLGEDRVLFSVLSAILKIPCERILTDHERLIICYSQSPFPVWIWMPEDAGEAEMARAWRLLSGEFPAAGYRYNVRREFGQYIMAHAQGLKAQMGMLAYSCPEPVPPRRQAQGRICPATMEDLDRAAEWEKAFRLECGVEMLTDAEIRAGMMKCIAENRMFMWEDGGRKAMCHVRFDGDMATFSGVYTAKPARRRGYAANLIYGISSQLRARGMMPTLYTDEGYAASNACYMQIGFIPKGGLLTLAGA